MESAILPVASHHSFCITRKINHLAGDVSDLVDTVRKKGIFGFVDDRDKRVADDYFNRVTWRIGAGTLVNLHQRFSKIVLRAQADQECNEEDRNARAQGTQPEVPKQSRRVNSLEWDGATAGENTVPVYLIEKAESLMTFRGAFCAHMRQTERSDRRQRPFHQPDSAERFSRDRAIHACFVLDIIESICCTYL